MPPPSGRVELEAESNGSRGPKPELAVVARSEGRGSGPQAAGGTDDPWHAALREAGDLDAHLAFTYDVLDRHEWSNEVRAILEQRLRDVEDRRRDPCLYLAVVGEFSAGKSTFINALLRDELLKTDIIQATTSTATLIRHADEVGLRVVFGDGTTHTHRPPSLPWWRRWRGPRPADVRRARQALVDELHRHTADEQIAARVSHVVLGHPAQLLRDGLVIVDTPGANADNPRHGEALRWAMRTLCDAAVVVVPSDVPVSQTLLAFLRSELADSIHRCVFVTTKLDLVRRPHERERLMKTIGGRLASGLNLSSVRLFGSAPQVVLDVVSGDPDASPLPEAERDAFLDEFVVCQEALWRILQSQRAVVILERVSMLMDDLYDWLSTALRDRECEYRKRHDLLEQNQIGDLVRFLSQEKTSQEKRFRERSVEIRAALEGEIARLRQQALDEIQAGINRADSKGALKSFLGEIPGRVLEPRFAAVQTAAAEAASMLVGSIRDDLDQLTESFRRRYPMLQALSTDGGAGTDLVDAGGLFAVAFGEASKQAVSAQGHVLTEQVFDGLKQTGSAGAGAALGTVLIPVPVLGTAVGAAVGWLAGSLFTASLERTKSDRWNGVRDSVQGVFDQAHIRSDDHLDAVSQAAQAALDSTLEKYRDRYAAVVTQMIDQHRREAADLARRRAAIESDFRSLRARQDELRQLRTRLRNLEALA